MDVDLTLHP